MINQEEIRNRITELMNDAGVSANRLSSAAKMDPDVISRYIRNKTDFDLHFLRRLAKNLKIDVVWLRTGDGPKPSKYAILYAAEISILNHLRKKIDKCKRNIDTYKIKAKDEKR